jgi:hypothetical protein
MININSIVLNSALHYAVRYWAKVRLTLGVLCTLLNLTHESDVNEGDLAAGVGNLHLKAAAISRYLANECGFASELACVNSHLLIAKKLSLCDVCFVFHICFNYHKSIIAYWVGHL